MTREEAIAKVKGYLTDLLPSEEYDEVEEIIKALEQEPKTEWIPAREKLPENFQRVLVTVVNYDGYKVVRVAEYYGKQRIFQVLENRNQWEVGEKGLLAWRPLPEPYKAESEHKRTIDADELLKRIAEKAKTPSLSEDTINGLCGATAIIYDMLNESGQEKDTDKESD